MNWDMVRDVLSFVVIGMIVGFVITRTVDNTIRIKALENNFKSYQAKMISE